MHFLKTSSQLAFTVNEIAKELSLDEPVTSGDISRKPPLFSISFGFS